MTGFGFQPDKLFRHHDDLRREILSTAGLALDVFKNRSTPLDVEIALHATEFANIVKVSGAPARVSRGRAEIASDGGDFLAVEFQRAGRTVFESGSEQAVLKPGELLIWHGERSLRFDKPEHWRKICLFVRNDIVESMLPQASSYAGCHLEQCNNMSRLLGACLSTFADEY